LLDTDNLLFYRTNKGEKVSISRDVNSVSAINNSGCYYEKDSELYFFSFLSGRETKVGMEDCVLTYSAKKTAVAGVDDDGQLYLFSESNDQAVNVCKIGESSEICAVSDDASNVIWAEERKKNGSYDIYILKDIIPERIGNITIKEGYGSHIYAFFFDKGNSFVVYPLSIASMGGSSMLISYDKQNIEEISLPGFLTYVGFFDCFGNRIDSEDDTIKKYYIPLLNQYNSDVTSIYEWSANNEMVEIVDDIADEYYVREKVVYYIDTDGDFSKKSLSDKEIEKEKITTNVDSLYVPVTGNYAYVVKAGNLYYISLSAKDKKLSLVCNDFESENRLYITDNGKVIYYISNREKIDASYRYKGTLYKYVVGEKPIKIADDIKEISKGDSKFYSAEEPVIWQYVSKKEGDYIYNIGTIENEKFVVKVKEVKD